MEANAPTVCRAKDSFYRETGRKAHADTSHADKQVIERNDAGLRKWRKGEAIRDFGLEDMRDKVEGLAGGGSGRDKVFGGLHNFLHHSSSHSEGRRTGSW